MNNLEVEYKIELKDYERFGRFYVLRRDLGRTILFGFIVCMFCYRIASPQDTLIQRLLFCLVFIVAYFTLTMVIPYMRYIRSMRRSFANNPEKVIVNKMVLTEDEIRISGKSGNELKISYAQIKKRGFVRNYVFFELYPSFLYVIPVAAFSSITDAQWFYGHIMRKTANLPGPLGPLSGIKGVLRPDGMSYTPAYKRKPPLLLYFLGLSCFIPIFGFVLCAVVVLLGLFHFRNRWLFFTGIIGLIVAFFITRNGMTGLNERPYFREGIVTIAQSQVNDLMKKVEFYKLQHGEYPDSLIQVVEGEKFTGIGDPLLAGTKRGQPHNYHYRRIGNKYTLFSVGIDGVPYTKDDIYPSVALADTSKFGLVRDKIWDPYHTLVPYAPRRR